MDFEVEEVRSGGSSTTIIIIIVVVVLIAAGIALWFWWSQSVGDTGDGSGNGNGGDCIAPPPAPTGLSASPSSSARSINISWTDPGDVGAWIVYVSETPGVSQSNADASFATETPNFEHTNLLPGQQFYYRVTAVNLCGEGAFSTEEVNATSTTWPTKFRYCKRSDIAYCMEEQTTNVVVMRNGCIGPQCDYTGSSSLIIGDQVGTRCLGETPLFVVEVPGFVACNGGSDQTWEWDYVTGHLRNVGRNECARGEASDGAVLGFDACPSGSDIDFEWDLIPIEG